MRDLENSNTKLIEEFAKHFKNDSYKGLEQILMNKGANAFPYKRLEQDKDL